jgi:hypothetical protein
MFDLPPVTFDTYKITSGNDLPDARLYNNADLTGSFRIMEDIKKLSMFMKNTPRHLINTITISFTLEGYEDFDSYIVFVRTNSPEIGSDICFACEHIEIPQELDELESLSLHELNVLDYLMDFFDKRGYPDLNENLVNYLRIKDRRYE